MRAFLPLALLAVTACYSPRSIEPRHGPYEARADAWDTAPLQASIWYDEYSGHARFDVTRPANVAIFALRPGVGVEMIYPAFGGERRMAFSGGSYYVRTRGAFASTRGSVFRTAGSPYRSLRDWSMANGHSPIYILLIASEAPLDVGAFQARGTMNWLSRSAVTYSPYVTLEALAGDIVTNPSSAGWTTAMHVVWPEPTDRYRDDFSRYVKVQCGSGIVVVVPMDAWLAGYPVCPEQVRPDSATAGSTPGVRDVAPKRPQPPQGWMTASVDGVDLRKELERVREEHGKKDPGPLDLTPYLPTAPDFGDRTRTMERGVEAAPDDRWVTTRRRPITGASRPSARPAAPANRPEARPAPRPAPQARPRPEARPKPQARPKPEARPAPTPRPAPKPKPKPDDSRGDSG